MNRITEKRTRLMSMSVDEQARVLTSLVGWFGTLAETRPHHPAVSEFSQALDEADTAGDPPRAPNTHPAARAFIELMDTHAARSFAEMVTANQVRDRAVQSLECLALPESLAACGKERA